MSRNTSNRVYEDEDPRSDVVTEEECDTIRIYLPGYKKQQLKVQFHATGILKISGERPIDDNRWKRFYKEFRVPSNCDTKAITAKFEGGILRIRQPKLITPAPAPAPPDQPAEEEKTSAEPPKTPPQQQQPQPQPLPLPLPQPQPQPQPQKGFEEETKMKDDSKEKAVEEERKNGVEGKDQCEWKERPKQVVGSLRLFKELRKSENLKRLAISVLLVLSIGFYVTYMFKSFMGDDKESVL